MNKSFQTKLSRGISFEDNVAFPFLLDYLPDDWIEETRNHQQTHTGFRGPLVQRKHQGKIEQLALPDFRITEPNKSFYWIDAKLKKQFFTVNNSSYITIDPKAYNNYTKVKQTLGGEVFILFGVESRHTIYYTNMDNVDLWYTFNNSHDHYGKDGQTPCYGLDNLSAIGNW